MNNLFIPIGKIFNNTTKDLPSDFYIAGSAQGNELIYKTNTYRTFVLSIPGTTITNINEIVRNGNDLFLTCNFGEDNIIVSLINCQIKSNKLVYEAINYKALTGITFVHSMVFYEDYLYLSNRVTGQPVILGKINPYNLEEQTYFQLPNAAGYIGSTDTLKVYRGYIYTLISNGNLGAYLVKVDLSFTSVQIIYTTGTTAAKRINSPYPFYIYNDEIFIVWVNRSTGVYNRIGIDVLNLDGTEVRNSGELITTLDGTQRPHPHWMTIFNGKIVITSLYNKFICRIDCITLVLEDCINIGMTVTDDNSMMPNGYIYLNGEANIYDPDYLPKLLKIKYDNFTDLTEEIPTQKFFNGNGSVGSINYNYTGNKQPKSKEIVLEEFTLDAYNGTRLQPSNDTITGYHVQRSVNKNIGFSVFNDDDLGNSAQANITVKGPGPLYSNNSGISHYGAGYSVAWLKSSGLVYSDKTLNIATWNNNNIIFRTGASFAALTEKFTIFSNGTLKIHVQPTTDNSAQVLGRDTSGNIMGLDNITKVSTVAAPTSATAVGTKGEIRVPGDGFIYICFATNNWKKIAETPF
ncbi:hypothetical protein [Flavobacterium sp. NRK F7]|uniref:hypothetical protein n=1 Tax=Flavobacterium sp. NRK F7 TaxID=2954930 RepID=UPI0020903DEF|nr:hypothetical protein [Flavobacterium sp. NRK F7]MCO6162596.1 hypothetical protein [Flavobacterium sp. NRK F7]